MIGIPILVRWYLYIKTVSWLERKHEINVINSIQFYCLISTYYSNTNYTKHHADAGPCLTTAIWRCRKNSSQWQRSFQWKLRSHRLKFLRQRHVAGVRQGPGCGPRHLRIPPYQITNNSHDSRVFLMRICTLVRRDLYIETTSLI